MDLDSDSSGNSDWEECPDEAGESSQTVTCIFCTALHQSADDVWTHCRDDHQFDLSAVARQRNLDCFGYIKMVNYARRHKVNSEELKSLSGEAWSSDEYMYPVVTDDLLLQYDIEDNIGTSEAATNDCPSMGDSNGQSESTDPLLQSLNQATARAESAESRLEELVQELEKMRTVAKEVLTGDIEMPSVAKRANTEEDDVYFESYSHFSIHLTMLQDKIRTESYRDAIYKNRPSFEGKTVLDVGCGTGILSMFAAKGGASLAIGIDKSDVLYQAMDIVRENKLEDKVKLIKGCVEDVDIPVDKVDYIISEWMGYCLLFESMLDSVIYARDRLLSEGGLMLPNQATMSVVGVSDLDLHKQSLGYWDDVYGFRMTCMRAAVIQDAFVLLVDKEKIITSPCLIKDLDLCTCTVKDLEFSSEFKLIATKADTLTALTIYFDIHFSALPQPVSFSTGPEAEATHWKQTVFMLEHPLQLSQGEELTGSFTLQKNRKNPRGLKITLTFRDRKMVYYMN